ncbi:MAG: FtsX-like permease family protein [Parabacteroides sp.]
MLQHIFTLIWNQRRQNAWIAAELFLVSILLWYLVDWLYVMGSVYYSPMGFDIDHVYEVRMAELSKNSPAYREGEPEDAEARANYCEQVLNRLRSYPGVEVAAAMTGNLCPYNFSSMNMNFRVDTCVYNSSYGAVTPGYFSLFGIQSNACSAASLDEALREPNAAIVTTSPEVPIPDRELLGQTLYQLDVKDSVRHRIVGVTPQIRRTVYDISFPQVYLPFDWEKFHIELIFCVRVRPEADSPEFAGRLFRELKESLHVGNRYLARVVPLYESRDQMLKANGTGNQVRTQLALAGFLLVNIFLGIIGTFWFRTAYRRGEMGLRMAMGSSRRSLYWLQIGEALGLVLIAFLPTLPITFNITIAELIEVHAMPISRFRFFLCEGITLLLLWGMAFAGAWYPSRQSTHLAPAEALRYE